MISRRHLAVSHQHLTNPFAVRWHRSNQWLDLLKCIWPGRHRFQAKFQIRVSLFWCVAFLSWLHKTLRNNPWLHLVQHLCFSHLLIVSVLCKTGRSWALLGQCMVNAHMQLGLFPWPLHSFDKAACMSWILCLRKIGRHQSQFFTLSQGTQVQNCMCHQLDVILVFSGLHGKTTFREFILASIPHKSVWTLGPLNGTMWHLCSTYGQCCALSQSSNLGGFWTSLALNLGTNQKVWLSSWTLGLSDSVAHCAVQCNWQ